MIQSDVPYRGPFLSLPKFNIKILILNDDIFSIYVNVNLKLIIN